MDVIESEPLYFTVSFLLKKLNLLFGFITKPKADLLHGVLQALQGPLKPRVALVHGGLLLQQEVDFPDNQVLEGPVPVDVGQGGHFIPASEQLGHNESNGGPLDHNRVLFYRGRHLDCLACLKPNQWFNTILILLSRVLELLLCTCMWC